MNQQDRDSLQLWLDGELDAEARHEFEERLARDPDLRAELDLLERVGRSLQRSFAPPPMSTPPVASPASPESITSPAARPRWPAFVAGAVSAAAALLLWLQPWTGPEPDLHTAVGRSWLAVCGQPGAPNTSACASPTQVADYIQPLTAETAARLAWRGVDGVQFTRGVEPAPLDGLRVLELVVLPRTDVYLFVVPASADPRPALPHNTGWNLFRKACGPLVVYEVTPLQTPHALECLSVYD